ncbi:MAG: ABC transporter permease [Acidimicrobiales bacterium]|nr:ABC transporter permease [Acidimicrobiales bacterium]
MRRLAQLPPPLVVGVVLIGLWQGLLALLSPDGFVLPAPTEILDAAIENRTEIWAATKITGWVIISGLVAGVVLAVLAALLVTRYRTAREAITPLTVAINAIPIIALAPILNNWFGLTSSRSNQIIVVLLVFFPVFINTVKGLSLADPSQVELMESYAASKRQIMREVRIPTAMPLFFTALKLASSLAVIGAIVAEYFGGRQDALGPMITQSAGLTRYADAWAAVLAGTILGSILYGLAVVSERLAMPWHSTIRSESV